MLLIATKIHNEIEFRMLTIVNGIRIKYEAHPREISRKKEMKKAAYVIRDLLD